MPGPFPKPAACHGCSFEHTGGGFVQPDPVSPTSLLVYGEAPGEDEEREGKGFVGRSGRLLRGALQRARIPVHMLAMSNTMLCRPPHNRYPGLGISGECRRHHHPPELNGFRGPVIAYGDTAVKVLSGCGFPNILEHRGSVLPISGTDRWFVASIHPAYILHTRGEEAGKSQEHLYPLLALDASRAVECCEPRIPKIELPTVSQLREIYLRDKPTIVSVDIEGKDGVPVIVGLSWRVGHAYVLDWSPELAAFLSMLFASGVYPLFHNGAYDIPELKAAGVAPPEKWLDTINLAAMVDPSMLLRLQYQVLSWVPGSTAWKGLINHKQGPDWVGGDVLFWRLLWEDILTRLGRRVPSDGQEWYRFYNGLDAAWTFELFHHFRRELSKDEDRFNTYYMGLLQPLQAVLAELTERGMPFDVARAEYHKGACMRLERMAKKIADEIGAEVLRARVVAAETPVIELALDRERELAETGKRAYSRAEELTKARGKLRAALEALEEGFNIESNKQRTTLVYEHLGLPVKKNEAGNPTANEDALLDLYSRLTRVDEFGSPAPTIRPRVGTREEAARLLRALIAGKKWPHWRRNYLDPPLQETPEGPWLVTQYGAHRAETGRLTSGVDLSDPEKDRGRVQQVQNIPKKLRDVVRAPKGRIFVAADWAGIEWALVMYFAAEVNRPAGYHLDILDRFRAGELDPHRFLASVAFNIPEDKVLGWQRRICKGYTHGYSFDGSPWGLARAAGHTRSVGEKVCSAHDRAFKTQPWKDATYQEALLRKYVQTPLGWRRWFWGLNPDRHEVLATKIQATAADMMKLVLTTFERGSKREFDYRLMTTTHDSILIDLPEAQVEEGKTFLRGKMEQPIPWLSNRTWRCDVKAGETWRAVS